MQNGIDHDTFLRLTPTNPPSPVYRMVYSSYFVLETMHAMPYKLTESM
jgi:hypothetical protein